MKMPAILIAIAVLAGVAWGQESVCIGASDSGLVSPVDAELEALLGRMDKASAEVTTIEADITITHTENFSGRESVRAGKIYVKKPSDMLIDLATPVARKIWISKEELVDYRSDLKTGARVKLTGDDTAGSQVLGLSTTSAELRESFVITLMPPGEKPAQYVLTLTPREGVKADFTEAVVTVDAKSLLPVPIEEKNSELDESKVYALSKTKKNPRLGDELFTPKFAKDAEIDDFTPGEYEGP